MKVQLGNVTITNRSIVLNTPEDILAFEHGRALFRLRALEAKNAALEAELPELRAETERLRKLIDAEAPDDDADGNDAPPDSGTREPAPKPGGHGGAGGMATAGPGGRAGP